MTEAYYLGVVQLAKSAAELLKFGLHCQVRGLTFAACQRRMFAMLKDGEVLGPVVVFDSIDVVDVLV